MIPNEFQDQILNSKKRVGLITAAPGAGTTTGLLMWLASEASKNKNNIVFYCQRTLPQLRSVGPSTPLPGSRFSAKSMILSVKSNGRDIKIKFITGDYPLQDEYITAIAFDHYPSKGLLERALKSSGKVLIATRVEEVLEDLDYYRGVGIIKVGEADKVGVSDHVDHIKSTTSINSTNLPKGYIDLVYKLPLDQLSRLTRIEF